MRILPATLVACIIILLAACKKHDFCNTPPKPENNCDLAQVVESLNSKYVTFSRSRYRKEYDPYTGKVIKVIAGLFQLDLVDSLPMDLKYHGPNVYFLKDGSLTDTVLIATFDNRNRLIKLEEGNAPDYHFLTVSFTYAAGKLSNIHFKFVREFDLIPTYDRNGNVIELKSPWEESENFFYKYDLTVKAKKQFYSDDFLGDAFNSLFLAEFMRWLPDLEPVNRRIASRVVTGGYQLYNATLTNHVYDAERKLISYQVDDDTFTNIWNCHIKNNP